MKFLSYTKPAMKNTRQTNINIHRDAWVEINISNLARAEELNVEKFEHLTQKLIDESII